LQFDIFIAVPPSKFFLRFGGRSVRLFSDQAVFSETRRAAELLQQFSGFLFELSLLLIGHAPYLFLPCGLV